MKNKVYMFHHRQVRVIETNTIWKIGIVDRARESMEATLWRYWSCLYGEPREEKN